MRQPPDDPQLERIQKMLDLLPADDRERLLKQFNAPNVEALISALTSASANQAKGEVPGSRSRATPASALLNDDMWPRYEAQQARMAEIIEQAWKDAPLRRAEEQVAFEQELARLRSSMPSESQTTAPSAAIPDRSTISKALCGVTIDL